jgi:hypothetical protein
MPQPWLRLSKIGFWDLFARGKIDRNPLSGFSWVSLVDMAE